MMPATDLQLTPAMRAVLDARGANLAQTRLLLNAATEEVDSLVEEIIALHVPPRTKARLLDYCRRLHALNAQEGELEREAAGILDEALTGVRTPGKGWRAGQRSPFTVKSLARQLRPALAVITAASSYTAADFVSAVRCVDDIVAAVPREHLLSASVRNALGPNRYQLLEQLVVQRLETAA